MPKPSSIPGPASSVTGHAASDKRSTGYPSGQDSRVRETLWQDDVRRWIRVRPEFAVLSGFLVGVLIGVLRQR